MRVVFDTNVLVAALRSDKGASFALVYLLPSPKFEIAVSVPLYFEYLDVAMRPEIKPAGLSDIDVLTFVRRILSFAHRQKIYFRWRPVLSDSKDDMILELAVAARCSYIVTFNIKDFKNIEPFGIEVISPSDFFDLVRE